MNNNYYLHFSILYTISKCFEINDIISAQIMEISKIIKI